MKKRLAKYYFFIYHIIDVFNFIKRIISDENLDFKKIQRERERVIPIRKGFTLVEMLIVVVIIGILAVTILPRLTGYLAKTRDMKRQVDLRNIAAAIELYKDQNGKIPVLGDDQGPFRDLNHRYGGSASELFWVLRDYISSIPSDPNKNIVLHNLIEPGFHRKNFAEKWLKASEYLYLATKKADNEQIPNRVLLAAKVETPEAANYVRYLDKVTGVRNFPPYIGGFFFWVNHHNRNIPSPSPSYINPEYFFLCPSGVKKSTQASMQKNPDGTIACTYTDESQLFYIVTVEL